MLLASSWEQHFGLEVLVISFWGILFQILAAWCWFLCLDVVFVKQVPVFWKLWEQIFVFSDAVPNPSKDSSSEGSSLFSLHVRSDVLWGDCPDSTAHNRFAADR